MIEALTRSFLFRIHSLTLTSLTVWSLALFAFLLIETETLLAPFPLIFRKHNELFTQPTRCLNTFEVTTL